MPVSTSSLDQKAVLLRISNTSELIKRHLRGHPAFKDGATRTPPSRADSDVVPILVLPYPCKLVESVRDSQVPSSIQDRVVMRVEKWYQDVRRTIQGEYSSTFQQLSALPQISGGGHNMGLQTFYESFFEQKVSKLKEEIESKLKAASADFRAASQNGNRKAPFKQECLPLLETYFEHNAYPSPQDRALLARKTKMCPRQIEVWFQNHRTRARKEGRQLRRLSHDALPHRLKLESINQSMPESLVRQDEIESQRLLSPPTAPTNSSTFQPSIPSEQAPEPLCAPSLAYIFPAKYGLGPGQASCLLSGNRAWSFPPPAWPRQASSKARTHTRDIAITLDELAVKMQKLSLSGAGCATRPRPLRTSPPAWYPLIVVPLTAPHFALICRDPTQESTPTTRSSLVPLPIRRLRDRKLSPFSKYERLAPYPKRHSPQNASLDRRNLSRSSRSPSSSASSVSSSEESELRTPSPSPPSGFVLLPKDASTGTLPLYPDWDAWLLPT